MSSGRPFGLNQQVSSPKPRPPAMSEVGESPMISVRDAEKPSICAAACSKKRALRLLHAHLLRDKHAAHGTSPAPIPQAAALHARDAVRHHIQPVDSREGSAHLEGAVHREAVGGKRVKVFLVEGRAVPLDASSANSS